MNTFRIFTRTALIIAAFLFLAGCTATAVPPDEVVEVPPTNTPEPMATATAVPSPTATSVPTSTPTATLTPTPTPTTKPLPTLTLGPSESTVISDPFSLDYLVTTEQLNTFSEGVGITDWELEEEVKWDIGLCRSFVGVSWSIIPNIAVNCIFKPSPNISLEKMIESLFPNDKGPNSPDVIIMDPSISYESEHVVYGEPVENGHSAFNVFVMGDGVVYWAGVSIGRPGGYTLEDMIRDFHVEIEEFLHEMIMINLGQSEKSVLSSEDGNIRYLELAQAHYESGEFTEAHNMLLGAMEGFPEIALTFFDEQVSIDPANGFALYGRGLANNYLSNIDEAIADYSQAITLAGEDPMRQYYYLLRGAAYDSKEDVDNAIADWYQTIAIAPDNTEAYIMLEIAYINMADYEKAVEILSTAISQNIPENNKAELGSLLVRNAEFLTFQIDNKEKATLAVDVFTILSNSEIPELIISADLYNNVCWYGSVWGLAEDALFACELAVEMDPQNVAYRDSRGLARALTGDIAGAIEDFQFVVTEADNQLPSEVIAQREEWIAALEAGTNPFTEALLNELRTE